MKTTVLICALRISLLICFASSIMLVSCNHNDAEANDMNRITTVEVSAADTTAVAADDVYANAESSEMKISMPAKEEPIETKIIKSGNLRYQTDDLDETYNQIRAAVKKFKASVKNDSQNNGEYGLTRNLNIRIPNENFDAFIAEISKGVNYFDTKEISSQDVTEEYVDVASRIKTKKILEERYYELLKKANKISEMLEIEKQLSEIREEIEAKEGRLKYLENKVSMSTLEISFYKPLAQGSKATVSYGGRIGNAFVSGFNGISNFFIELLGIWPVIVTLVVLFILIRKRLKRKNEKGSSES